ncbi:MAG: molybdate ABC transporter substrate-binding protein [Microbacteriaceae bacterium]|nr:molybdate ABC transporter substrate-binding protein [Microbacteriaceae bacterium]
MVLLPVVLVALVGCSAAASAPESSVKNTEASADPSSNPALSGTIVVDAAASLTGSFTAIASAFKALHPDVTVTLNFGSSAALASAIVAGAPVDVFAAASATTMATVTTAGLTATPPKVFARNSLEIAVPPGNPGKVSGIRDFGDSAKKIALCAPQVPCGAAAAIAFAAAGVTPAPSTLEQDVKAALTKVQLGEVDAAMVYRTDVIAAGSKVIGIEFAESAKAVTSYPIAPVTKRANSASAAAFAAFVLTPAAQTILANAGFQAP